MMLLQQQEHPSTGHLSAIGGDNNGSCTAPILSQTMSIPTPTCSTDTPIPAPVPSWPVLFAGDINMGPVLDPQCMSFSGHYSSREDAIMRHQSYRALRSGAGGYLRWGWER